MGQGRNRKIKGRETIKNKQVLLMNNKNKKEKLFLCGCGLKEGKGLIVFLVSFSECELRGGSKTGKSRKVALQI